MLQGPPHLVWGAQKRLLDFFRVEQDAPPPGWHLLPSSRLGFGLNRCLHDDVCLVGHTGGEDGGQWKISPLYTRRKEANTRYWRRLHWSGMQKRMQVYINFFLDTKEQKEVTTKDGMQHWKIMRGASLYFVSLHTSEWGERPQKRLNMYT